MKARLLNVTTTTLTRQSAGSRVKWARGTPVASAAFTVAGGSCSGRRESGVSSSSAGRRTGAGERRRGERTATPTAASSGRNTTS